MIYASIAWILTNYNMKAILLYYNGPIIGLGDGDSDLHRHDWQVNTKDGPTKLVRQDAILGGLLIGKLYIEILFVNASSRSSH